MNSVLSKVINLYTTSNTNHGMQIQNSHKTFHNNRTSKSAQLCLKGKKPNTLTQKLKKSFKSKNTLLIW